MPSCSATSLPLPVGLRMLEPLPPWDPRFLRLLDHFRQVGDDLLLHVLRHRAGIALADPLLHLAHLLGDLQQRVLRLDFLLGRGAKLQLKLLLHRIGDPIPAVGLGRIAQQFAIVVIARLGIQAIAELVVGRGRRVGGQGERSEHREEKTISK